MAPGKPDAASLPGREAQLQQIANAIMHRFGIHARVVTSRCLPRIYRVTVDA
ncbi:MAG TPA: hypothetical protein VIM92_10455 [Rhodanobacteraceae bacterium]